MKNPIYRHGYTIYKTKEEAYEENVLKPYEWFLRRNKQYEEYNEDGDIIRSRKLTTPLKLYKPKVIQIGENRYRMQYCYKAIMTLKRISSYDGEWHREQTVFQGSFWVEYEKD